MAYHPTQIRTVFCADVPAAQCFAGVCESVHDIREKCKELHQKCVHREDDFPLFGALRGKKSGDCYQTERTKEDIPVELEEFPDCLIMEDIFPVDIAPEPLIIGRPEVYRHTTNQPAKL